MKRNISLPLILVTVIFVITGSVLFILPHFDFMYVSADKHWLRGKIADQDENTGGRAPQRVGEGETGIYFVYKDRLMYMETADESIREICQMPKEIRGVLVKDNTVLFCETFGSSVYSITSGGEAKEILDKSGRIYMEGDYIYTLSGRSMFKKFDFQGKKIFLNDLEYDGFSSNIVFDDYVLYRGRHSYDIKISVPHYYLFDINKIKYQAYELKLLRYYLPPAEWERPSWYIPSLDGPYWDIAPWDSFAQKIDQIVREGKAGEYSDNRDLTNYDLKSIQLLVSDFSEVSDGYIYIFGTQEIVYRDKDYEKKIVKDDNGRIDDEEIQKIEVKADIYPMFRVSVEDIKKSLDHQYIDYKSVYTNLEYRGELVGYTIKNKVLYLLYHDRYADIDGYKKMYVYATDADTGLSKKIYERKESFQEQVNSYIFCTEQYIFLYEYNIDPAKICITRMNRDGSNPVLVMDENGEVVIKPFEME